MTSATSSERTTSMRKNEPKAPLGVFTENNPYGYKLNINHPTIKPYYERYKRSKGIKLIPSDKQRLEFEAIMLPRIKEKTVPSG